MWQAMRPHRRLPRTIDTDIDAVTPMLRRYSRWIGETLRNMNPERASELYTLATAELQIAIDKRQTGMRLNWIAITCASCARVSTVNTMLCAPNRSRFGVGILPRSGFSA